jgi:hypothetical protein
MSDRTCCGECNERDLCRVSHNCCTECHFSFEEQQALPYLPYHLQQQLIHEHEWLIARGLPHKEVMEHAEREMAWFNEYVPDEIIAQIERDHCYYANGMLKSREQA